MKLSNIVMSMNALTQYIELYNDLAQRINAGAPAVVNALRPAALKALEDAGRLPAKGDEGYEYTSLNDMLAPDFGLNIDRICFNTDLAETFRCDVPRVSTLLAVVVNDVFRPTASLQRGLPEGVRVLPFSVATRECPEVLEAHLGKIAPTGTDTPTDLNTLLMQDGVLVWVKRGVHLDKPLQLVNILDAPAPLLAPRRLLVVIEDDASARLLVCDHTRPGQTACATLQVTEVALGRHAAFDYYEVEESDAATARISRFYARQQTASTLNVTGATLSCGSTRNDYNVEVDGDHCHTRLCGMATGMDSQLIDNATLVRHHGIDCHSNQLFKYVLTDKAHGAFEGLIVVDQGAKRTEAFQTNRNLLAAPQARMHTRPQLEIYCDDVKCSHGATTGQLDQRAMFYMRSRGIPEAEARLMLMQAFMADVIDSISLDGLRDRLRHLVERRLCGSAELCADCNLNGAQ